MIQHLFLPSGFVVPITALILMGGIGFCFILRLGLLCLASTAVGHNVNTREI